MAETLEIIIDVGNATAELKSVADGLEQVGVAAKNIEAKAGNSVKRLADAMANFKPFDPNLVSGINSLGAAMQALTPGNLNSVANELNKIGRVDVEKVTSNIQKLADALANLKLPPDLGTMASALHNLAGAAGNANAAVRGMRGGVDPIGQAIASLNRELLNMLGYMANVGVSVGNIIAPLRVLAGQGVTVEEIFKRMGQGFSNLAGLVGSINPLILAVGALTAATALLGPSILDATMKYQQFVNVVDAIKGRGAGAKEFQEVIGIAQRTGQSIDAMATSYSKFLVASSAAGQTTEKTRQIFEGFSTGLRVMGASVQQVDRAFVALTQMMSKGTVGAEELRQQLGDAMPSAMADFAKALGVSIKQLQKMMEAGQVIAADVIPKVARNLQEQFGPALERALRQPQAALVGFQNAIQGILRAMGEGNLGGFAAGFAGGLRQINAALDNSAVQTFVAAIGDLMGVLSGTVMGVLGGVARGFAEVFSAFVDGARAIGNVLAPFQQFISAMSGGESIIGGWTNVIGSLARGLGVLIGIFAAAKAAQLAWAGAIALTSRALGVFSASAQAAFLAASMLQKALIMTGIGAAVVAIGALLPLLSSLIDKMVSASSASDTFSKSLTATSTSSQVAASALSDWAGQISKTPGDVMAAVNAFSSFASIQEEAKQKTHELKVANQELQHQLKALSLADKEAERESKRYTDGLKAQKQELTEASQRIQRMQENMKDAGLATKGAGDGMDLYAQSLKRIKHAQEDLENAMRQEQELLAEDKRKRQEAADAIRMQEDANNKLIQRMAEYKASLTDIQVAEVERLKSLGLQQEKAVELVTVTEKLTQTINEQADAIEKRAQKEMAQFNALQQYVDKLQITREAEKKRLEGLGEEKSVIDARLSAWDGQIAKLQQMQKGLLENIATEQTFVTSVRQGIPTIEAAQIVLGELAKQTGVELPKAMDISKKAFSGFDNQFKISEETIKKWGEVFKVAMDAMLKVLLVVVAPVKILADAVIGIANAIDRLAGRTETATKSMENVKKGFEGTGEAAKKASTDVNLLSEHVKKAADAAGGATLQNFDKILIQGAKSAAEAQKALDGYSQSASNAGQAQGNIVVSSKNMATTMSESANATQKAMDMATREADVLQGLTQGLNSEIAIRKESLKQKQTELIWAESIIGQRRNEIQDTRDIIAAINQERHARGGLNAVQEESISKLQNLNTRRKAEIATAIEHANAVRSQIGTLREGIEELTQMAEATELNAIAREHDVGIIARQNAESNARIDAVTGEADALDLAHQKMQTRLAELDKERDILGRSREQIIRRRNELEEEQATESMVIGATREKNEAIRSQLATYEESIRQINMRQDAIDQEGASIEATMARERAAVTQTSGTFFQAYAQMGDAQARFNEETKKLGNVTLESASKMDNFFASLTGADQKFNVVSSTLGNLGQVVMDASGKIISLSDEALEPFFAKMLAGQSNIQTLSTEAENLMINMQGVGESFTAVTPALNEQISTMQGLAPAMSLVADAQQEVVTNTGAFSSGLESMNAGLDAFRTSMSQGVPTDLVDALNELNDDFANFRGEVQSTSTTSSELNQMLGNTGSAFRRLDGGADGAEDSIGNYREETRSSIDATIDAGFAMDRTTSDAFSLAEGYRSAASAARELANAQSQLDNSSGSGGGSTDNSGNFEGGRQGGRPGQLLDRQMAPMDVFTNAPSFAEGIDSTDKLASKLKGGGKPVIVHPNEAIIPLSRGRKVPVEIETKMERTRESGGGDFNVIAQSIDKLANILSMRMQDSADAVTQASTLMNLMRLDAARDVQPQAELPEPMVRENTLDHMRSPAVESARRIRDANDRSPSGTYVTDSDLGNKTDNGSKEGRGQTIVINIHETFNLQDVDGINRTSDQRAKRQAEKVKKVMKNLG